MVAENFDARALMTIAMTTSTIGLSLNSSKRSPDERSDIRVLVCADPAYRFAYAGYSPNRSARSTFLRKLARSVPWRSSVFESPIRPLPADEGSKPNGLIAIQAALSFSANASI
jgi:hypothetical protein